MRVSPETAARPHRFKQGDRISSSGFLGVVVREYSCRMYEIRLPGGLCCVDEADILGPFATEAEALANARSA